MLPASTWRRSGPIWARLCNDLFSSILIQNLLGMPQGSIRAAGLIEHDHRSLRDEGSRQTGTSGMEIFKARPLIWPV